MKLVAIIAGLAVLVLAGLYVYGLNLKPETTTIEVEANGITPNE